MKRKGKSTPKKEEIAEDWCFTCKDGGELLVCDYKQCLKSYHPDCVGKDDSFLKSGIRWTCDWHICYVCRKASDFQCYCCPNAVCGRCIKTADFVHVRGKKGFCNHCLKLALLVEEKKDVDSDGEAVDFKDRETYEGLFREYWEIINSTENLSLENLISANAKLKTGNNYKSDSDSDKYEISEENQEASDYDDINDEEPHMTERKRKKSKGKPSWMKGKAKPIKTEFTGWGSKSLVQFLTSIGKDTTQELSQREVSNIINGYIKENKLLHSQKKKMVVCDAGLQSFFGKKMVNKHKIYDLLEDHFAENQEQSEEDELGFNSEDDDDDNMETDKRKRKSNADKILQKKEMAFNIPRFNFASIIPENIKLVYLKRSLVQKLLEQPETFESKVIGSFVRVKADPNDFFRKNSYQLVQVTGIRKSLVGENNQEIFLQLSDIPKDICISLLSDDDFSEEECHDLRDKVKAGLHQKLTVDALEQKAKSLHEDITKHWIPRELALLQNRIDRANEKGWRRELFEYLERRQFLQNPTEQSRLIQKVPTVVPDVEDLGPAYENMEDNKKGNEDSPKSILRGTSEIPCENFKRNRASSDVAAINEKSSPGSNIIGSAEVGEQKGQAISADAAAKVTEGKRKYDGSVSVEEEWTVKSETYSKEGKVSKSNILASEAQLEAYTLEELEKKEFNRFSKDMTHILNGCVAKTKKKVEQGGYIEFSDESDDDDNDKHNTSVKPQVEDIGKLEWNVIGLHGLREGPCSLSLLKNWSDKNRTAYKCKVWKASESEEHAIPLADVINRAFPKL